MLDVNEARRIANENGFDKKVEKKIKEIEERIRRASENGHTSTCAFSFYQDYEKSDVDLEVKKEFLRRGFTFKKTGLCGGVPQTTEDICW